MKKTNDKENNYGEKGKKSVLCQVVLVNPKLNDKEHSKGTENQFSFFF